MKGFGRNVKADIFSVGKLSAITYAVSFAVALWFWFLDIAAVGSVADFLEWYIKVSIELGAAYIFLFTAYNCVTLFNQQVSYGCTRRCTALGMVLSNLMQSALQIVVTVIVYLILHFAFGVELPGVGSLLAMINVFLVVSAVSPIAAGAVLLWGRIGYYVVILGTCIVASAITGVMIGMEVVEEWESLFGTVHINLIIMFAAVVGIVLTTLLFVKMTARREVCL